MKAIPRLQKYMTTTPYFIEGDQSIQKALEEMKSRGIRHLPVMNQGRLTGLVTDRDIKLALGLNGVDPEKTKVSEISVEDPYLTSPDAALDEVVIHMAERKLGSALIVDNHKLVGIFTSTDAMRIFGETLRMRH